MGGRAPAARNALGDEGLGDRSLPQRVGDDRRSGRADPRGRRGHRDRLRRGWLEDDTRERIEAEIERRSDRDIQLVAQQGTGKWNAVQEGFDTSTGELLVILDGDMTVDPEELVRVYEAIASGQGEFVNGNRLVYGMEPGAMRFLNMVGNKFFAALLSRVLGQYVKDTLCGTKAILRQDWELIRRRRDELGARTPTATSSCCSARRCWG